MAATERTGSCGCAAHDSAPARQRSRAPREAAAARTTTATPPDSVPEPIIPERAKAPVRAPASSASARPMETLLERVAGLRSRGQYGQAAQGRRTAPRPEAPLPDRGPLRRGRGQYGQAAEELANAMPPVGTPGAESASYELGSIL